MKTSPGVTIAVRTKVPTTRVPPLADQELGAEDLDHREDRHHHRKLEEQPARRAIPMTKSSR